MWRVTAEEDLRCTECGHAIRAGTLCLSQMPVDMPEGFRRRKYDNYCITCTDCSPKKDNCPCYVRWLNHWYTPKREVPESIHCGYCGSAIPRAIWVVTQKLYAWPKYEEEWQHSNRPSDEGSTVAGVRAAGTSVAGAAKRAQSGVWRNLTPSTQRRFQTRGLGRGIRPRSPAMAQRLYEASVPEAIRNQGESAVLNFLKNKHASHIRSVAKTPSWAKRPSNILWETPEKNLSRGSRNMTASEVAAIKSANRVSAVGATVRGAAKGGVIAAAIEAPMAIAENFLHWMRGRKSRGKAAKDAARDVGGAAAVGLGVTAATTLVGISPTLGPAGFVLLVGASIHRLYKAAQRDIPLDEYYLYFCDNLDCKTQFAQSMTDVALGSRRRYFAWAIGLALVGLSVSVITIGIWFL